MWAVYEKPEKPFFSESFIRFFLRLPRHAPLLAEKFDWCHCQKSLSPGIFSDETCVQLCSLEIYFFQSLFWSPQNSQFNIHFRDHKTRVVVAQLVAHDVNYSIYVECGGGSWGFCEWICSRYFSACLFRCVLFVCLFAVQWWWWDCMLEVLMWIVKASEFLLNEFLSLFESTSRHVTIFQLLRSLLSFREIYSYLGDAAVNTSKRTRSYDMLVAQSLWAVKKSFLFLFSFFSPF